jgi:hypothetical protein
METAKKLFGPTASGNSCSRAGQHLAEDDSQPRGRKDSLAFGPQDWL